jgi:hypothetical protein
MTGQHAKPTVFFGADHEKVRQYIDDVAAKAINDAAHSINKVRAWCDQQKHEIETCPLGHDPDLCPPCTVRAGFVAEIRALLPDLPAPTQSGPGGGDHMDINSKRGGDDDDRDL